MNTPQHDSQSEPELTNLQKEAFDWLVRLTSGDTSPEEVKRFDAWKASSPAHEQAWQEASRVWQGFEQLPKDHRPGRAPLKKSSRRPTTSSPKRRKYQARTPYLRWAAALTTTAMLFTLLLLAPPPHHWLADISTGVGERRTMPLPDGSTVEMNSQTALQLEFTDTHRIVELLSGEAAFQVEHDAARPFVVSSDQGNAEALGTEFIVGHRDAHTLVAVREGTVEVRYPQHDQRTILNAGEAAGYSPAQGLQPMPLVDWDMLSAWRDGYLVFDNTPLADVLAQINLHRTGHIILLDDSLADHRISGLFRLDAMADVVTTIVDTTPARLASITPYLVMLY
ncbi:MAG: sensor [Nitrospirales bacterium]|nr:MAG: sensor [Nitrospirales bacterium]